MSHKDLTLAFLVLLLGTLISACVAPPRPTMQLIGPVPMELVRVPAGEFLMGSDPTKDLRARDDEKPQHRVMLAEFYIGKYEVTNAQYAAFVKATGRSPGGLFGNIPAGKEEYPVVGVTWDDTVAFTQWLSEETGKAFRLCTEAEWEKACRGTSGFIYPWGDTWDANRANVNVEGVFGATAVSFVMTPVGSFSPAGDSPYGVADMAGNAWERVADWYDDEYYARAPAVDPQGPETGIHQGIRVIRGGTYANGTSATCANRGHGSDFAEPNVGLRVCVSPDLAAPGQ